MVSTRGEMVSDLMNAGFDSRQAADIAGEEFMYGPNKAYKRDLAEQYKREYLADLEQAVLKGELTLEESALAREDMLRYDWESPSKEISMNLDEIMIAGIAEAVRNTNKVCEREHVKITSRHERVGEFVTQLRRSLGHKTTPTFVGQITERRYWYDAGVLDPTQNFHASLNMTAINSEMLRGWCYLASGKEQSLADEIDGDLIQLKADLNFFHLKNDEADRLNQQAENVADALLKVIEPLHS